MIKPSIGRVVLVYFGPGHIGTQWYQASICYVHSDTAINVAGTDGDGRNFISRNILLRQDDVATDAIFVPEDLPLDSGPFACWMPYQRKVAGV